MEKKNYFTEYTEEEKKTLLLHWWGYMDVVPYSLVDVKMLDEVIDIDADAFFRAAFASDCPDRAFNKEAILRYLEHYSYFKEYQHFFDVSEYFAKEKLSFKQMREFIGRIVDSYNQKKYDVSLVRDCCFVDDYNSIPKEEVMRLTSKRVRDIFSDCIIKDIDKTCYQVYSDFTIGQGIEEPASVFKTSSLNKHRDEIYGCLSMLPCLAEGEGISVLNLKNNKYGREWATTFSDVDYLVRLGTAAELIYFPFPKDEWVNLPGGKPFIASCMVYDKNRVLEGNSPDDYEKVVMEYKKKLG